MSSIKNLKDYGLLILAQNQLSTCVLNTNTIIGGQMLNKMVHTLIALNNNNNNHHHHHYHNNNNNVTKSPGFK